MCYGHMKTSGWIEFQYKLPYSAIDGRTPPYDFPVVVATKFNDKISYEINTARIISETYIKHPALREFIRAWRPIEEYIEPRG